MRNHSTNESTTDFDSLPDGVPNLLDGAGEENDPLAAMRGNPDYAELIRELELIAQAARDLFPVAAEEPSPKVWDNIVNKLNSLDS